MHRRAAPLDRELENAFRLPHDRIALGSRQSRCWALRTDSAREQRLCRINVADARDERIVHDEFLHGLLPPPRRRMENLACEVL